MRVRRVRPRALRGVGSLYTERTASPALSLGESSFDGGVPRHGGEGSPLGGSHGRTPHVLVPRVSVTPEVEVVGDGETTLWVAVEVGAQLGRPDGAGTMVSWNGWGTTDPDLGESHANICPGSRLIREQGPSLMDVFTTCR